jgi:hypothetical protein
MKKKKYLLKSEAGINSIQSRELDDFTEEDFNKWVEGTMPKDQIEDLQQQASEDQHFEWWIEESTKS